MGANGRQRGVGKNVYCFEMTLINRPNVSGMPNVHSVRNLYNILRLVPSNRDFKKNTVKLELYNVCPRSVLCSRGAPHLGTLQHLSSFNIFVPAI